ncbi:MAG: ribonuclease J [Patescibacteria group bacterium]
MKSKRRLQMAADNQKKRFIKPRNEKTKIDMVPKITKLSKSGNKLKLAIMGGAEEVGRNMTMIEYGDDIILIDCGLQFPEEDQPGIDYIIPNVSCLRGREKNVRGIIITHGHYDHIGGLPHVSPVLHNPPIYGTKLTLGIIEKRQEDFNGKLDLRVINSDDKLNLGQFRVEFFRVNHNIPDCVGIIVRTPEGTIVHTGDFKFDYTPVMDKMAEFHKIAKLGEEGVLALLSDSTNAENPGQQISESKIGEVLEDLFSKAKGRIIVGTFASLLTRVQQVIWLAEKTGRKVVIEGFSMKNNVAICQKLGYLEVNSKTLITAAEGTKLPEDKLVIMCTGAQGEGNAALMRIAGREHKYFHIQPNDTVIFSSSIVPGNERTVQKLKDTIVKEGATVMHYKMMDVHAGGHAQAEDLKLLYSLVKPKYIMPVEGNAFMLRAAGKVAETLGWEKDKVIMAENGKVVEFSGGEAHILKKKLDTDYVMVDGLGVGDVSNVVLRDRQLMSEDGMFVIIATVDSKTGALIGSPDIISRGFVYMKNSKKLIEEARAKVKAVLVDKNSKDAANTMYLKNKLRDEIGRFLFLKTQRRPMILPVVLEV